MLLRKRYDQDNGVWTFEINGSSLIAFIVHDKRDPYYYANVLLSTGMDQLATTSFREAAMFLFKSISK